LESTLANSVELLGFYGSDETHALSAWTSTSRDLPEEKRKRIGPLLTQLAKDGHLTPFEKSSLHFLVTSDIASHIHLLKHRIGVSCLAGSTSIQFLNTNGDTSPKSKITIADLWVRWNKGRPHQDTPSDKAYVRRRFQNARLESLDEGTLEIGNTKIVRVIHNGVRQVQTYCFGDGKHLRCTDDHLVFTEKGWQPIGLCFTHGIPVAVKKHVRKVFVDSAQQPEVDTEAESWRPVRGYEGYYEVSNQGRVRSFFTNRYPSPTPTLKSLTEVPSGHLVVSLKRKRFLVHHLVLDAFVGSRQEGQQARHLNNNAKDNRVENLAWGTDKQNKDDWMRDHGRPRNRIRFVPILKVEDQAFEEVFDLEVEGPYHNFTANSVVVHNCNAESARYKELKDDKAHVPSDWPKHLQEKLEAHTQESFHLYHWAVRELEIEGMNRKRAKESARFFLPYANQITCDVMFNWRSFAHFLGLRNKPDAQVEIRELAAEMLRLVEATGAFPLTIGALREAKAL
jgi:thymidylate synthase ThyX